jgi:diguanylate cyclase (GGDEF)-like protein/PAS domain S-box-containing protein
MNEIPSESEVGPDERFRLYEAALAAVAEAVVTIDAASHITYLNPAAESLTGRLCREAVGKPLTEVFLLVDPLTDRRIDRPLEEIARSCESHAGPVHVALVDRRGSRLGFECRIVPMRAAQGWFCGAVLVCRDVSRRRAVEIALQNSAESLLANANALFEEKERAQVTLNSIGDAVISTDFRGQVSYLNVVAEKMTGWIQSEASGVAVDEIFRLVDAATGAMIACPTTRAIIEDRTVSMQAACVLVRRGGTELAVEVSASPIHDTNGGVIGAVMVAHDVTAARELSSKLVRLALHDSLTDLPNRSLFNERLTQAIDNASINGTYAALLYVDLDRFKLINDSLGHAVGDQLLQTVARRLLSCVRNSDTVSRQGGDEFVVVLAGIARSKDAAACADKILIAMDAPLQIGEHELQMTVSIGVAIFPDDAADADSLLKCADLAMYQAKYAGRNTFRCFAAGMDRNAKTDDGASAPL